MRAQQGLLKVVGNALRNVLPDRSPRAGIDIPRGIDRRARPNPFLGTPVFLAASFGIDVHNDAPFFRPVVDRASVHPESRGRSIDRHARPGDCDRSANRLYELPCERDSCYGTVRAVIIELFIFYDFAGRKTPIVRAQNERPTAQRALIGRSEVPPESPLGLVRVDCSAMPGVRQCAIDIVHI